MPHTALPQTSRLESCQCTTHSPRTTVTAVLSQPDFIQDAMRHEPGSSRKPDPDLKKPRTFLSTARSPATFQDPMRKAGSLSGGGRMDTSYSGPVHVCTSGTQSAPLLSTTTRRHSFLWHTANQHVVRSLSYLKCIITTSKPDSMLLLTLQQHHQAGAAALHTPLHKIHACDERLLANPDNMLSFR